MVTANMTTAKNPLACPRETLPAANVYPQDELRGAGKVQELSRVNKVEPSPPRNGAFLADDADHKVAPSLSIENPRGLNRSPVGIPSKSPSAFRRQIFFSDGRQCHMPESRHHLHLFLPRHQAGYQESKIAPARSTQDDPARRIDARARFTGNPGKMNTYRIPRLSCAESALTENRGRGGACGCLSTMRLSAPVQSPSGLLDWRVPPSRQRYWLPPAGEKSGPNLEPV